MKEHPIIFSGPMVEAILQERKTQTRRIIYQRDLSQVEGQLGLMQKPLHSLPGNLLWVKETWRTLSRLDSVKPSEIKIGSPIEYRADGCISASPMNETFSLKWRTSLFMPRWCSRINLKITRIRFEQLQQISKGDAEAEGVPLRLLEEHKGCVIAAYHAFWNQIHGSSSWESNPWVRVIEFEVLSRSKLISNK